MVPGTRRSGGRPRPSPRPTTSRSRERRHARSRAATWCRERHRPARRRPTPATSRSRPAPTPTSGACVGPTPRATRDLVRPGRFFVAARHLPTSLAPTAGARPAPNGAVLQWEPLDGSRHLHGHDHAASHGGSAVIANTVGTAWAPTSKSHRAAPTPGPSAANDANGNDGRHHHLDVHASTRRLQAVQAARDPLPRGDRRRQDADDPCPRSGRRGTDVDGHLPVAA